MRCCSRRVERTAGQPRPTINRRFSRRVGRVKRAPPIPFHDEKEVGLAALPTTLRQLPPEITQGHLVIIEITFLLSQSLVPQIIETTCLGKAWRRRWCRLG